MRELRVSGIPEPLYEKLLLLKAEHGYKDRSWLEWVRYLTRGVNVTPTLTQRIRKGTRGLLPLWMRNFSDNLEKIRSSTLSVKDLVFQDPQDRRALVIGRGPSLFRLKHLELLKEKGFDGWLVACDGILIDMLKRGVVPDFCLAVDGSELVTKWFDHDLVRQHGGHIKAVICSTVHPKVIKLIEEAGMPIYWFIPAHDDGKSEESFTRNISLMTVSDIRKEPIISMECLGQVGGASIVFSWSVLKSREVGLIGLDYGYPADMPLEETYYWKATVERMGALDASTVYEKHFHPFFQNETVVDPAFHSYREGFMEALLLKPPYTKITSCVGGGSLYSPLMDYAHLQDWLKA